ncbi:hypothetical protein Vadar_001017 [Vaccinium darrowii]|uniref:Uncharacterized protein n=1 Tax=Vaccinium darrowii TaxID=229202 RepID=A0ACB7ZHK2_9ERIC|nr:hypothetical protein Vadar_001017 [Vaccinium darrowii]
MDFLTSVFCLLLALIFIHLLFSSRLKKPKTSHAKLPPGPNPIPVLGNLLNLDNKPHKSLAKLAKIHGPLITLKLGSVTTIVISSPAMAKLVLQKHDVSFSNRTIPDAIRGHNHHELGMPWIPVSPLWRNLRKICNSHIFTSQSLAAKQNIRRSKIQQLLSFVRESCDSGVAMDVGKAAFSTTLNLLSNTMFSIDLIDPSSDSANEFKELVWNMMEEMGKPNLADYFPALKRMDPQGRRRRLTGYFGKMIGVFDELIKTRLLARKTDGSVSTDDILHTLLGIEQSSHEIDRQDIEHLFLDRPVESSPDTFRVRLRSPYTIERRKNQNMDFLSSILCLVLALIFIHLLKRTKTSHAKLPPGPNPIPVLGNLLNLDNKPHKSLAKLAKIHGPLMTLKLGSVTTIVVSSPSMAKLVLQKHDVSFSSRTIPDAIRGSNHDELGMPWVPVSTLWRTLRKICNSHIFTSQSLAAKQNIRGSKIQQLLLLVRESCDSGVPMDIGKAAFSTTLNFLSNTMLSIDLIDPSSDSANEFKELVWNMMEEIGKPNLADYFPALRRIDPQGRRRRLTGYAFKMIGVFDEFIKTRLLERKAPDWVATEDMLDTLLGIEESGDEIDRRHIEHLFVPPPLATTHHPSHHPPSPPPPLATTHHHHHHHHAPPHHHLQPPRTTTTHHHRHHPPPPATTHLHHPPPPATTHHHHPPPSPPPPTITTTHHPPRTTTTTHHPNHHLQPPRTTTTHHHCHHPPPPPTTHHHRYHPPPPATTSGLPPAHLQPTHNYDLFVAGTDTTANTLEWAMAELLHNPAILLKAQEEMDHIIGKGNPVEEVDLALLPYLQAIIKETLRLHPPTPLLLPRKAEEDVEICGFTVPKGAQVLVNAWAIGRDESTWDKPELFRPERFLGSEIDVKGQHFELIPFGAGRRICPAVGMANRMLQIMLASLVHSFDWKLDGRIGAEDMDMEDESGITVRKAQRLRAIPVHRMNCC